MHQAGGPAQRCAGGAAVEPAQQRAHDRAEVDPVRGHDQLAQVQGSLGGGKGGGGWVLAFGPPEARQGRVWRWAAAGQASTNEGSSMMSSIRGKAEGESVEEGRPRRVGSSYEEKPAVLLECDATGSSVAGSCG